MALREIINITKDRRKHVTYKDSLVWEKTKQRAIAIIARRGLYVETVTTTPSE